MTTYVIYFLFQISSSLFRHQLFRFHFHRYWIFRRRLRRLRRLSWLGRLLWLRRLSWLFRLLFQSEQSGHLQQPVRIFYYMISIVFLWLETYLIIRKTVLMMLEMGRLWEHLTSVLATFMLNVINYYTDII